MYREQSLQKHRFAFAVITGDRDKEGLGEQFQGHQVKHTLRGGGSSTCSVWGGGYKFS